VLDPIHFGYQPMGLHRNAEDHLVLNDEPSDALADRGGLIREHAEQQRHQLPKRTRAQNEAVPMRAALQQSIECSMN
jgi:hypothetical protein